MGYRLYLRGVALTEDGSDISLERDGIKVNLSLKRVGSVVMVTSVAWAALSWMSKPQTIDLSDRGGQRYTSPPDIGIGGLVAAMGSQSGSPESAVKTIDLALSKSPDSEDLIYLRALALANAGRPADAEKELESLLASRPGFLPAIRALSHLHLVRGDMEGAVRVLEGGGATTGNSLGLAYSLAQLRMRNGEVDRAKVLLEEVVRADPDDVNANNDLAWLLASEREDLPRALQLAKKAASKDPSAEVLDTLGWVYFQSGQPADAIRAFEQALKTNPDRSDTRYRLSLALLSHGDRKGAQDALRAALKDAGFSERDDRETASALLESSEERWDAPSS
jgi:predicted Zn-dependent protease